METVGNLKRIIGSGLFTIFTFFPLNTKVLFACISVYRPLQEYRYVTAFLWRKG